MISIIEVLAIYGLIKLLDSENNPVLCAVLFSILHILFQLIFLYEANWVLTVISFGVTLGLSLAYFYILQKLVGMGSIRTAVAIIGGLILLGTNLLM
jgi:hypothetical protein